MSLFAEGRGGAARVALFCALAAFLAYLPSLSGEFVWDDHSVYSAEIPTLHSFFDVFTPPPQISSAKLYYRPMVLASHYAEEKANTALYGYAEAGSPERQNPRRALIPHLVTLFWHVAASALAAVLLYEVLAGAVGAWAGALAGGLFFALHPAHAESAAFIVGRSDSMASAFFFAALALALRARNKASYGLYLLAGGSFLLALMSKETAVAGLVLLPLLFYSVPEERKGEAGRGSLVRPYAIFGAAFTLYLLVRLAAGHVAVAGRQLTQDSIVQSLFQMVGFYVRQAVIPWPTTPLHYSLPSAPVLALAFAAALVLGWLAWKSFNGGERRYAFAFVWFFATLAPALAPAFFGMLQTKVAERFLYLPVFGISLALAVCVAGARERWKPRAWGVAKAMLGALLLLFFGLSWRAAANWRTDVTLLAAAAETDASGTTPDVWMLLGRARLNAGDAEGAKEAFMRALSPGLTPKPAATAAASFGLGEIAFSKADNLIAAGDFAGALKLLEEALPHYARAMAEDPKKSGFRKKALLARLQAALLQRETEGRAESGNLAAIAGELEAPERLGVDGLELDYLRRSYEEARR